MITARPDRLGPGFLAPIGPPSFQAPLNPWEESWKLLVGQLNKAVATAIADAQRKGGADVFALTEYFGNTLTTTNDRVIEGLGIDGIDDVQQSIDEPITDAITARLAGALMSLWQGKGSPFMNFNCKTLKSHLLAFNAAPKPTKPKKAYAKLVADGDKSLDGCIVLVNHTVDPGPPPCVTFNLRNDCDHEVCFKYRVKFSGTAGCDVPAGQEKNVNLQRGGFKWIEKCVAANSVFTITECDESDLAVILNGFAKAILQIDP